MAKVNRGTRADRTDPPVADQYDSRLFLENNRLRRCKGARHECTTLADLLRPNYPDLARHLDSIRWISVDEYVFDEVPPEVAGDAAAWPDVRVRVIAWETLLPIEEQAGFKSQIERTLHVGDYAYRAIQWRVDESELEAPLRKYKPRPVLAKGEVAILNALDRASPRPLTLLLLAEFNLGLDRECRIPDLPSSRRTLGPQLRKLIRRGLAKRPDGRLRSGSVITEAGRDFLAGER